MARFNFALVRRIGHAQKPGCARSRPKSGTAPTQSPPPCCIHAASMLHLAVAVPDSGRL
jgi:hypothetical protein